MNHYICPSCHCSFKQEFLCTTCGAEKLNDATVESLRTQLETVKAAFDDRVRVIEMQLKDKAGLEALLREYREALERVGRDQWPVIEEALAQTNPTAALNAAIADELERLEDEYDFRGLLAERARELRG